MEETTNSTFFTFDSPKGQSSYIKVIGVGGGGGNAVNHMYDKGIEGVDFIVCNTDMKALNASPVPNKIPLGDLGLGAGNKPERARRAAEAKADDIREALSHNTQMLFITAGMGGGTGTGAAPVIAEIAKSIDLDNEENKKILVVAIVTRPFSFEGTRRREQAEAGIQELRKYVDSIIVINNDKLRSKGNFGLSTAFGMADDVLLTAAKGIAEIITESAYVNRDFQDVNTVMEHSGTALMGTGSGKGENRAHEAIEAATTSELLDDSDIAGAKNVLLYFTYSSEHELTMDEMAEITDYVLEKTNGTADIIWGAGPDDSLGDELKVILIATGFEKTKTEPEEPKTFVLPTDTPKVEEKPVASKPDSEGMELIHREEPAEKKEETPVAEVKTVVNEVVTPAETPATVVNEVVPEKHVYKLEDEPSIEEARQTAQAQVSKTVAEADSMVEDIRILTHEEPRPAQSEVKPETKTVNQVEPQVQQPASKGFARSAFENDNDVATVADRIKHIHDLLRNSANGADIVQSMNAKQMAGDMLFEGRGSAVRESSSTTVFNGRMVQNPFFRDQAD